MSLSGAVTPTAEEPVFKERKAKFRTRGVTPVHTSTSPVSMAYISTSSDESYPGRDFSISQLLHAAKRKLQSAVLGGRSVYAALTTLSIT